MAILKNDLREKYSQIPNAAIMDQRLSALAFRMLAYLFSLPTGWQVNNADIQRKISIKDKATIASKWSELLSSGWLNREQIRQKNEESENKGRFDGGYQYVLCEPEIPLRQEETAEVGKNPNSESFGIGKNPPT